MKHCVTTIIAIVAQGSGDRRSVLQLGYNLGRLSELTGLGRETFWDRWKTAIIEWNQTTLDQLARELPSILLPQTSVLASADSHDQSSHTLADERIRDKAI